MGPLRLDVLEFLAAGFVAGTEIVDLGLVLADGVVLGPDSFDIGGIDHQEEEHQVGRDIIEHLLVLCASGKFFEGRHGGTASLILLLHMATIGNQILLEGVFVDGSLKSRALMKSM